MTIAGAPSTRSRERAWLAIGLAGFEIIGIAAVMVPLREHLDNSVVALVIVLPVIGAGIIGGRLASLAAAVIGAAAFDFWFTHPYLSLKMHDGSDLVTALVLAAVAMCAAEIGLRLRRARDHTLAARSELNRFFRLGELAVRDTESADMISAVRAELIEMFALVECQFEEHEEIPEGAARLGVHGALEHAALRMADDGFALPLGGVAIAVQGRGCYFGYLWLTPTAATSATAEQRFVAAAIARELALVLAFTSLEQSGKEPRA